MHQPKASFYANYRYHLMLDLLNMSKNGNLVVNNFAAQETIKFHLQETQGSYKISTNKCRKKLHLFQIGKKTCLICYKHQDYTTI